jgi:hypothetical protein
MRNRLAAALVALVLVPACAHVYYLDLPDIDLPQPVDLRERLARCRSGEERWHSDPRAVADIALRESLNLPWKGDRFRPDAYELKWTAEWGDHVVRGYRYPSGNIMRYRVKIRKYQDEIWYAVQVSRYKMVEVPEEGAHEH